MVPFDLPSSIQRYVAVSSIGSSTVQSRPSGTLDAARSYLETQFVLGGIHPPVWLTENLRICSVKLSPPVSLSRVPLES